MSTEADTCRTLVLPKLYMAGWTDDQLAEQRTYTAGRIIPQGQKGYRKKSKRVDYLLRYTRDFFLAVVEAKQQYKQAADGLQQAKDYAQDLGLKFAYSTNGHSIIEFDFITGLETIRPEFPSPAELWSRLKLAEKITESAADTLLTPYNLTGGKEPYYYQRIAIDRAIQCFIKGQRRVLLTMATGTGITVVAFQIRRKLWSSKWLGKIGDVRRQPGDTQARVRAEFIEKFCAEAGNILNDLLEKYATDGEDQFVLSEVLKTPPISDRGNVGEIIEAFDGPDKLRAAVNELQTLLYAA